MITDNQTNRPINEGLGEENETILNIIVNKNIVIIQYNKGGYVPGDNGSGDTPIIKCDTRVSIDFGKNWKEIQLNTDSRSMQDYSPVDYVSQNNLYDNYTSEVGENGCLIEFIVRRGDGGRAYMYTPMYNRLVQHNGNGLYVTYPNLIITGYLVHDLNGNLINPQIVHPLQEFPEIRTYQDAESVQEMFSFTEIGANTSTGQYNTGAVNSAVYKTPFVAYPYLPIFHSDTSASTDDLKIVNRTDTVDYTHDGNRYTIVKRLATVYIRRGNISLEWDPYSEGPGTRTSTDYYILVLPFLYVFDHKSFSKGETNLVWVDFLNLNQKLASLNGSMRPSGDATRFIKSLFTDDIDFQTDTGSNNTMNTGTDFNGFEHDVFRTESNIVLDRMPYGELLKITDNADKKELLGFLFGNRRFVCTGNPTIAANWVQGETKTQHLHPTTKEAFTYKLNYAEGIIDLSTDPKAEMVTYVRKYGSSLEEISSTIPDDEADEIITDVVFYRRFNVFGSKNPPLRINVAGDRAVAIPDTSSGDIIYKFACFIKDPVNGKYTIGFKPDLIKAGYSALVDAPYSNSQQPYPVRISSISGGLYNTSTFIINEVVNGFTDPFPTGGSGSGSGVPPSVPITGDNDDDLDLDIYTLVATECIGFNLTSTYRHPTNNTERRVITQNQSPSCGYTSSGAQMPIPFSLVIVKDVPWAFSFNRDFRNVGSATGVFVIKGVLTGDGRMILRPRSTDIVNPNNPNDVTRGFDIHPVTKKLTITFTEPGTLGLNASNNVHEITIDQDITIPMDKNYTITSGESAGSYGISKTLSGMYVGNEGGMALITAGGYRSGNDIVFILESQDTGIPGWNIGDKPTLLMLDGTPYRNPDNTAVFPYDKVMGATNIIYKVT